MVRVPLNPASALPQNRCSDSLFNTRTRSLARSHLQELIAVIVKTISSLIMNRTSLLSFLMQLCSSSPDWPRKKMRSSTHLRPTIVDPPASSGIRTPMDCMYCLSSADCASIEICISLTLLKTATKSSEEQTSEEFRRRLPADRRLRVIILISRNLKFEASEARFLIAP